MAGNRRRRRVAALAFDGIGEFHLAVPQMVFGLDGVSESARYEVTVCTERPGPVRLASGLDLHVPTGLGVLSGADVVVIPSWRPPDSPSAALIDALRTAHANGALVVGLCLGSWVVAASGIVDGRSVATHWHAASAMAEAFPDVDVQVDALWCDVGDVVTSAGVAAALDCCLHVVRRQHGSAYAAQIARSIVLAPHRSGSQAQFVAAPIGAVDDNDPVGRAIDWALAGLAAPIELDEWAQAATMSRRTFSRRFAARTGTSPMRWLLSQRIDRARELLETTDASIDHVAARAGFVTAATMRHHFRQVLGVTPTAHRAAFHRE